jgi:hypothetical protein
MLLDLVHERIGAERRRHSGRVLTASRGAVEYWATIARSLAPEIARNRRRSTSPPIARCVFGEQVDDLADASVGGGLADPKPGSDLRRSGVLA